MIDPDYEDNRADIGTFDRTQRTVLTVFLLVFTAVAVFFLIGAFHRSEDESTLRTRGTHVQGVVVQHYVKAGRTAGRNGSTYNDNDIVVRYLVGSVPVHHTFTVNDETFDRLTVGRTAELIYDPDNPYLVMMAGPGDTQTGPKLILAGSVLAGVGLACVVAVWIYWLRKRMPN